MVQIKMSPLSRGEYPEWVDTQNDWGNNLFIQGGNNGLVLSPQGNYYTAFVEVFSLDGTEEERIFIRGEGENIIEAENKAWESYQKILQCDEHDYEPRKYTNGAGFCKKCKKFGSKVFTGEQLNQYCIVCDEGSLEKYDSVLFGSGFYCEKHRKAAQFSDYLWLKKQEELSEENQRKLSLLKFFME